MAKAKKITYTQQGYQQLVDELQYLRVEKREKIKNDIALARSFGDLSENAEYDEARNEQAKNEARIKELEEKLENAEIIDESTIDTSVVSLGSAVKVLMHLESEDATIFEDFGELFSEGEKLFRLVGSNETNPMEGKLSDQSLVGEKLINQRAGDEIVIELDIAAKLGAVKGARTNGCKCLSKAEDRDGGIFKCRISHAVDLVITVQAAEHRAVPECMRTDHVNRAHIDLGQEIVTGKGIVFNNRDLIFLVGGEGEAGIGLSLGIFEQTGKDLFILLRNKRIAIQHTAYCTIIDVVRVHGDRREVFGITEGAIPDSGKLFALSVTDKGTKFNARCQLVAVKGVTVKADNLVKTVVVGNERGDHNLCKRCVTRIVSVLLGSAALLTDDRCFLR